MLIIFGVIWSFTTSCETKESSIYSFDTKSFKSKDGNYSSNSNGADMTITVFGNSWSGSVKLCEFCDSEFQSGTIDGNNLFDDGGSKIGYFSGENLTTTIGGNSIILRK